MSVYKAIIGVQAALAKEGIAKDKTCTQGATYKFRGIDDIYNALAPLLAANGLCILPRILARECVERVSKNGGALFYTTVEAEFDFVAAEDGSKHTVKTFGEAMDSGDKGTNKAMSAAYKYAAFQAFCIPTEGDNDADGTVHEVKPQKQPTRPAAPPNAKTETGGATKAPASQEQIMKITELCVAIGDREGKSVDAVLRELSEFPGTTGPKWLTPENIWKQCTAGWAGKIISAGEKRLAPLPG